MTDSPPEPGWSKGPDGLWHPPPAAPPKASEGVDEAPSVGWVKGADGLWHPPPKASDTSPATKPAPSTRPATSSAKAEAAGAAASPPSVGNRSHQTSPTPTVASATQRVGPTPPVYATGPAPSSSGLSTAAVAWMVVGAVALVIVIAIAAIAASTSSTNDAATAPPATSAAESPDEPAAPQSSESPSAAPPAETCDQSWAAFEGNFNPLVVDWRETLLACDSAADWASGWNSWGDGSSDYALDLTTLCGGHPELPEVSPPRFDPPSAETVNSPTCTTFFDRCHTPFRPGCLESPPTANDPPPSDNGPGYVDQSDLEADIRQQVEIETGRQDPNVSCPGELISEPGATLECEASFDEDGMFYPVTVEVDSLTGDTVNYYITVGTPLPPGE